MLTTRDRVVMEQLARLRLVGRRDKKGSEPFYEVEHEYLAENWARLAGWLAEARDDRALADELERDAAAYACNHEAERLWRKRRLAAAVEMVETGHIVLNASATQFLQQAQRQERRGRLAVKALIAVAVVLAVVYALVLKQAASDEHAKAVTELQRAEVSREAADRQSRLAQQHLETADQELMRAEQLRNNASRELEIANEKLRLANQELADAELQARTANQRLMGADQKLRDANERTLAEARANAAAEATKLVEIKARQAEDRAAKAGQSSVIFEARAKMFETRAAIGCVR